MLATDSSIKVFAFAALLLLVIKLAQVLLVLFSPLVAAAFIFKPFGGQDGRSLARPQLLFFNRYLVSFLRHFGQSLSGMLFRAHAHCSKTAGARH